MSEDKENDEFYYSVDPVQLPETLKTRLKEIVKQ
jgi:hypothetical protein